jgi:uncharacterized protein
MTVQKTYPGVYIEEIPSGVRTIVGVATSITAFVGRTYKGPTDEAMTISSFADFERSFGGLQFDENMKRFSLCYAVRDFFANGGNQAIIARAYKLKPQDISEGKAKLTVGSLNLEAASPGAWGKNLSVITDHKGINEKVAPRYNTTQDKLFNMTVTENDNNGRPVNRESFLDVSIDVKSGPQYIPNLLSDQSQLVRLPQKANNGGPDVPTTIPSDGTSTITPNTGSDGDQLTVEADWGSNTGTKRTGLYLLDKVDLFNLLCIPPDDPDGDTLLKVYQDAEDYCFKRRAMLIVDPPADWEGNPDTAASGLSDGTKLANLNLSGDHGSYAAIYFPRIIEPDPLMGNQLNTFAPCGAIAGIMARTDAERGVWKAPAGLNASISGITGFAVKLNDADNGILNPLGINCLRDFKINGKVVWGARTMRGADQFADEWKYIPIRRLALFIEESLFRGTQWVVFEPNDEPLWAQIRLNVGAFMQNLFRQGAFQGSTPTEAYFVKCDHTTNPQNDIDLGILNMVVGFAPLKPAEFVVIKIQQMAGQIQT